MNPLFGKGGYGIGDVIRIFKQAKQNPGMIGDLLYQNGRIDHNQMQAINGMNPQQMAQYLSQNGVMNQRFLQQGDKITNPIRHSMNQN